MGRPESGPSVYQPDNQPQTEYDLQSQEYQSEQTQEAPPATPDEYVASTYETNYYQENQQDQCQQPQPNDPQAQQQFQQPQPQQQQRRSPPPPAAQQQQPQQYPPPSPPPQPQPQANMGYGAQPGQPGPQPHQNTPMYSNGLNQQPVAYPPQSPQPMHPVNYPPQVAPQAFAQANYQASQPVQFSPQNNVQGGYMGTPSSPLKPAAQVNYNAAQGYPVHMSPMPQPQPALLQVGNNEAWKTELFGCMDDPMNALITVFFPCLTFGQVAEIVDNGHTSCGTSGLLYGLVACLIWLPCIMSCSYRTKLRSKFGLVEAPAPDCITHFLCECCALCQEYRELQLRGFDPSIGWQGNVMKNQSLQQQQVAMLPPVNQRMMG